MRFLITLFVLSFLTTGMFAQVQPLVHDFNITGCRIGKPTCKLQRLIQKWKLVDCRDSSMWMQTLRGEVLSVGHNKTKNPQRRCKLHDGDWGICINPYPEYSWLSINSKGKQNHRKGDNQPGYIKAEIKLGDQQNIHWDELDLRKLFPPGSNIETCGWWVQDYGHRPTNPATEIHPFIYMRTLADYGTADSFSVFIADDCSERFMGSGHDISWSFSVPIKSSPIFRKIDPPGNLNYNTPLTWLEETFIVDQFDNDSTQFAASKVSLNHARDSITWNIFLSHEASAPLYRGIFRRHLQSDTSSFYLQEQIHTMVENSDGNPIYKCVIKLELISKNSNQGITTSSRLV